MARRQLLLRDIGGALWFVVAGTGVAFMLAALRLCYSTQG